MKRILSLFTSIAACASIQAADVSVATNITEDTVWTNDNTYILDAQVYVVDGAALTIEPGTVVKGAALQGSASALIVSRGSRIYALGTPSEPIIFTAEADTLDGSLDETDTQLWGGVIILGAAPLNSESRGTEGDFGADPQVPFTDNIEGLENSPDNDWTEFGGLDPEDSSGIFRYVSIRHGGSVIGANNEINGLTMGGVGSGTLIEFVEVFANKDDGFEWFGGTVNARYLVSAFGNDDSFDYDQGWTGKGQFWFSIGTTGASGDEQDHGGEHDGTVDFSQEGMLRGMGTVYNATYVGASSDINEGVFEISDDAGARYYNSIFMSWGHGVDVLDDALPGLTEEEDGVARIDFRNNIWHDMGAAGNVLGGGNNAAAVTTHLTMAGKGNTLEDPMLRSISRAADGGLDPRPAAGSPALGGALMPYSDDWYIPVNFKGAIGRTGNWMNGWTKLSIDGYLPEPLGTSNNRIANVAIRTDLDVAAGEVVAMGVVVSGTEPRMVLIRAEGAGLANNAVANYASSTAFQIIDPNTGAAREEGRVWTNWAEAPEASALEVAGDYVGLEALDNDSTSGAALVTLNPGSHVIAVTNPDGTGGEALISATIFDF